MQLLDIYTTYRGLKYDCVRELNPIIGEKPTIPKMFAIKASLLTPAIQHDLRNNQLTKKSIRSVNGFMALVVANNHNTIQRAQKYCTKK
tara:strand:+ start:616 stop:882 length:267 start_codon:yes stop_codon:yes gene_type:complete